jgi:acetyltransferase-like isoleucine patch superfamily enzyme
MFHIHPSAKIHPSARIDVAEGSIGAGAIIRENVVIEGRRVRVGREAFFSRGAWIGGGSCRDPQATLEAGDFVMFGANCHVNIGRKVTIGDESAVGVDSKIFTHGAYLSAWEGFPVQWGPVSIGSRVWLTSVWVNPGVTIGSDVIVAQRSVVTRDLPSGCIAAGSPAVPKARDVFPRPLEPAEKHALFARIFADTEEIAGEARAWSAVSAGCFRLDGGTVFDLDARRLSGPADRFAEFLRDQLRRNGIRFRFEAVDGHYRAWQASATDAGEPG